MCDTGLDDSGIMMNSGMNTPADVRMDGEGGMQLHWDLMSAIGIASLSRKCFSSLKNGTTR